MPTAVPPIPSPTAGPSTWSEPQQISDIDFGTVSIGVDADGFVHVAAASGEASPEQGIWYLTNRSGSWAVVKVAGPSDRHPDGLFRNPSLAVDGDGSVWIAFTRWPGASELGGSDGIFYVTDASGQWADPVLIDGPDFDSPALVVRDGAIHVAYIGGCHLPSPPDCHYPVYYGTTRGGSWASELVFEKSGSGPMVLDLDDRGSVQILAEAFRYPPETMLAAFETSGFANELVWGRTRHDNTEAYPLLLQDGPSGSVEAVWACFCQAPDVSLYRASRSEGSWGKATAVLRGPQVTSAAFTLEGALAVVGVTGDSYVYADDATGTFHQRALAAIDAGAWDWGYPGSTGSMGLALDGAGRPHVVFIVFGEDFDTSLWYATGPALTH
jgi:hypothetical protein